jgi:glycosyltransferase involved in cell wall biosynthesis
MFLEKAMREGAAASGRPAGTLSVCFVAPHAWPVLSGERSIAVVGGAEVQQAILARLFASRGYRVSMICLDFGQPESTTIDGVEVRRAFRMDRGVPVLRFVHPRLTAMWRALKAVDADIYYYRSAAMWVGVLAGFCRRHGKRLVYAGASDKDFVPGQGGQLGSARDRWLYRRGLLAADAIVAQNTAQVLTCRATYGRDAVHIPSCYRPPHARVAGRKERVLWVGTVYPNKRPELFLELARRLPHRRCVMIGGPRRGAEAFYARMRAEAQALPNVEFTGFLPLSEVEPWFDRARVLVNTSDYEGMPNTFLQAWARGVPTVATVDVGVAVHRVARDLDQLAAEVEDAYRAFPSAACRGYFERVHSGHNVLAHYAALFESLCARETPRSPRVRGGHGPLVRGPNGEEP